MNGASTTYVYDAKNRLTQDATAGTNAHTYDYSYDSTDNRLTSSETGVVSTFNYDAASRLTTSTNGGGITTYTFDPNGNLTNVNEPTGLVTMSYDKEKRLSVHRQTGSTATDALGSVVATMDNSGNVQNTYRYKPYGDVLSTSGSAVQPHFLWLGRLQWWHN